jgi:hypothetical protein
MEIKHTSSVLYECRFHCPCCEDDFILMIGIVTGAQEIFVSFLQKSASDAEGCFVAPARRHQIVELERAATQGILEV